MFGLFLTAFLVTLEECSGMAPSLIDPRQADVFPALGFELCGLILNDQTRTDCIACFAGADSDWLQANDCVGKWLPSSLAICADAAYSLRGTSNTGASGARDSSGNGNGGSAVGLGNGGSAGGNGNGGNGGNGGFAVIAQSKLQNCLRRAKNSQIREMNRANVLYTKGSQFLKTVGDSKIIEDGGATIFSCMAQELILGDRSLRLPLREQCGSCFTRFKMDPINEQWHLGNGHKPNQEIGDGERASHKDGHTKVKAEVKKLENSSGLGERTLVYQYGYVGNDMPYHGIGPFAVDILKGECIYEKMAEGGSVDALVSAILQNDYPVPAWIFRELLNNIDSITLPA
ncbi:uncharacterized protein [Macrobrachium rosenbergii]|uniref:uncharacterized protein n=1 Tax=Macrobrachium rosenbergii TaxID=79674 RepID=UPI0034D4C893